MGATKMVNKKDFFDYMSAVYNEEYSNIDTYRTLKKIIKLKDESQIDELKSLVLMNNRQRLLYRHAMAANGKELTPRQLDQYLTMIEYALTNMEI
jgi:hypothetical protein